MSRPINECSGTRVKRTELKVAKQNPVCLTNRETANVRRNKQVRDTERKDKMGGLSQEHLSMLNGFLDWMSSNR